ncbi:MAG: OmpH family outer membrane protein [Muribaculaceae bacterium]|nr:OmpH family outer membrane protein [Muribaculaceae bacterium]
MAALLIPMLASAQSLKIGLVDQNEIISKMPETTEAGKKVDEISKKYESEYMKLNDEMKRLYDEISNMKEDELPAIRERKTRDFTDHQVKVQQFQETAMQEIQRMQQELMAPIVQKVRSAIESVGKEGGFSLVQDKNPQITIYFDAPVIDITNDVKAKLGIK